MRKSTKEVNIGDIVIGGKSPVAIQSMTNTKTEDVEKTLNQVERLVDAGCEIIRISFPSKGSINTIKEYKKIYNIPLVGDIHFDYKLAIAAIEAGVDKIRINPGNIGAKDNVKAVIDCAKYHDAAIRIGVNGGSLPKDMKFKKDVIPVVGVAMEYVSFFEESNFDNIVLSVKMSSVVDTVAAYRQLSGLVDYPLHVGVTEAGTKFAGTIRSSIGIGALFLDGIGDTLRVSLTADPVEEVYVAKEILQSTGLRQFSPQVISCPTCGRTNVALEQLAQEVEQALKKINKPITVAVMGCAVNGPGEAKHADVGVACGIGEGLLFKNGDIVKKVSEKNILAELLALVEEV